MMNIKQSLQGFGDKIKQLCQGIAARATELYDNATGGTDELPAQSSPDGFTVAGDEEMGEFCDLSQDRFVYNPKSFTERLAVGGRVKNKLSKSTCVTIPYRVWCKYTLIVCLVLFGAFFTPQLLPKWLGFEWASPKDLCQNREEKLRALDIQIRNLTKFPQLRNYFARQQFDQNCMNASAANFYKRPDRFQWPSECTPEKASESLEDEVCVGPFHRNVCDGASAVKKFFGGIAGTCKGVTIPKTCKKVVDKDRTQALLDLEREQNAQSLNETASESQPIIQTANDRATQLINRLLLQVDIASDIYIAYSIVALIIGMPLIVYKREKGSRIVGATFGMRKLTFIIIVVIFLSMYDSLLLIVRETDFSRLFRNFRNDPCYVDAEFSRERVNLIIYACNNVTQIGYDSSKTLQDMDEVYFTTRRFGLCRDDNTQLAVHPDEGRMDDLRTRYRDGDLEYPGFCNATFLDQKTSTAPSDPEFSKFKALLGSGVLAQLFLKFIFTSWLVHLMAFREPMIVHNGKVEIWDTATGAKGQSEDELPLSKSEVRSAVGFARDKHLLPLIVLSVLMAIEVFLIIYSIIVTNTGRKDLLATPDLPELTTNFNCRF